MLKVSRTITGISHTKAGRISHTKGGSHIQRQIGSHIQRVDLTYKGR